MVQFDIRIWEGKIDFPSSYIWVKCYTAKYTQIVPETDCMPSLAKHLDTLVTRMCSWVTYYDLQANSKAVKLSQFKLFRCWVLQKCFLSIHEVATDLFLYKIRGIHSKKLQFAISQVKYPISPLTF